MINKKVLFALLLLGSANMTICIPTKEANILATALSLTEEYKRVTADTTLQALELTRKLRKEKTATLNLTALLNQETKKNETLVEENKILRTAVSEYKSIIHDLMSKLTETKE